MPDFVQLWVYLSTAPLFGLTATLVVYVVAAAVYDRVERAPWANPVLWSGIALGTLDGGDVACVVQYGGQTPLKLALSLQAAGVRILGTSPDSIDLAEDRERFAKLF